MIYCFNLGIGWASSGVEYAQSYRAVMLRNIGAETKFVFTEMFPTENIEHMSANIGFLDDEVVWLYSYFTDFKTSPVTYTLDDLLETISYPEYTYSREDKIGHLYFGAEKKDFYTIFFADEISERVHRVEIVSRGFLIRKDYFTYGRLYSEYYAPLNKTAHMYLRRFFNEDGSTAYEEINDDGTVLYRFPHKLICSKEELVGYMVSCMRLTEKDVVLIDRTTGIAQAILENAGAARVGMIVHADHFSEGSTDENNILWNNFYEYAFAMNRHINFYVTATDEQNRLLTKQFMDYGFGDIEVHTIPVGSLDCLIKPEAPRKPHSVITASRLAVEKHIDWIIKAIIQAKGKVPDITLDIYGKGGEEAKLREIIKENGAESYIRLMGQQNLKEVYKQYELYASGSTSEGFGLTLMEAIGSGLPIIGFDVRYGNPTFIDDGRNGYLIPYSEKMSDVEKVGAIAEKIIKLFTNDDQEMFRQHSYEKAQNYLTEEVQNKWKKLLM